MAVTIRELYQDTRQKYKLELLSGKESLDHMVSWVHLTEDTSTTDFIRGNELIITTGLGAKDEYWLEHFIESLLQYKAIGLIVNVGTYISVIPNHTIEFCRKHQFPLFQMPWEIHLVDIMQEYCNRILTAEQIDLNESKLFLNILTAPENRSVYEGFLEQNGYDINGTYCVGVIHRKDEGKSDRDFLFRKIRISINNIWNRSPLHYTLLQHNKDILIIMHGQKKDQYRKHFQSLWLGLHKDFMSYHLRMSVGPVIQDAQNLVKSYRRGKSVLKMKKYGEENLIFYEDIGIDKILLGVDDKLVLADLYEETLGPLLAYDQIHGTQFMEILRLYLQYNSSVQAVAEATYTHRNTINYRMKKIREILGSELEETEERFRYQLAFHIGNILEEEE